MLCIIALTCAMYGYSQSATTYVFRVGTGTYTPVNDASATRLTSVEADEVLSATQNIGFTFSYEGVNYTQFKMGSNGFISFNTSGTSALSSNNLSTSNTTSRPIIAPLWDDHDGRATGSVSRALYEVTGTAPNRVLTVEWRNWEWNYLSSTPVISFQVKLYETTNVIEFHYRSESGSVSSGSASIGIGSATGTAYLNLTSVAVPAVSSSTTTNTISTKPATGTIYRFVPPTPCSGTPVAGTPQQAVYNFCPGASPTINVFETTAATGLSFAWETSANGIDGWTDVTSGTGGTTLNYTTPAFSGTDVYYRMRATCTNGGGVSTTTAVMLSGPVPPTTQVSAITSTAAGTTSLGLSWTNGNGNYRSVFINNANSFVDPISPAIPGTAATVWANAGQQLVFDGTGTSVTVTGLTPSTTYFVRAYESQRCTGTPNTYFYNTATATNNPNSFATSSPIAYEVTRNTGITYNSIQATGTNLPSWSSTTSGDDNLSASAPIGFDFVYQGRTVNNFKVCTNGWLTLAPATTTDNAWNNSLGANSGIRQAVIAPFWEDLVVTGQTYANINNIKYELSGTAPNRILTVEWSGMETYNNPGPNLNFQVKLYETTNNIEFVYGNMSGFDGTADYGFAYSVGLNGFSTSGTLGAGDVLALQNFNTKIFAATNAGTANTGANALNVVPACNSSLLFTPGTYTDGTPLPAITNDEPAGAIGLAVGSVPPTEFCDTYSSAGATASTGITACTAGTPGTPDDDVWFRFNVPADANTTITVRGAGGYNPVVQLFSDAGTTSLACNNAMGSGLTENIAINLTAGSYFVRVYHAGTGSGTTPANGATAITSAGNFYIGVYTTPLPPANDDICNAVDLSVSATTCVNTNGTTVAATASTQTVCGGTADDDVWYSFTATGTSATVAVASGAGFNAHLQVFSSADNTCTGTLTSLGCINNTSTAGVEFYTATGLTAGNVYFIRVYHTAAGSGSGSFRIAVLGTGPIWTGATSTDWLNSANWCGGFQPSSTSNVIVGATANNPVLSGSVGSTSVRSLSFTNSSASSLTITSPSVLTIDSLVAGAGDVTLLGTGSVRVVRNVNVTNNNTLTSNGLLTLVSTSTNTAVVPALSGTSAIAGDVIVQRFLPSRTTRKSLFLASPVTARIDTSWQQQIHITGAVGVCPAVGTGGVDLTQTGNPSMFTYSASMQAGQRWVPVLTTNGTTLNPGVGYRVLVRGDRSGGCALLDGSTTASTAVTLSAKGLLAQGNINATLAEGFTLVGNPYPSPISFDALAASNTDIDVSYWSYNPANANGVFSVFNAGTLTNKPAGYINDNIIASGQAFFVRKATPNFGTLTFQETHKSTTAQAGLFRTQNWLGMTRIALRANDDAHLDETVVRFGNQQGISNLVEGSYDALNISEGTEGISSQKAGNRYSIQTRTAVTSADTVSLHIVSNNNGSYKLYFGELQIGSNNAILIDKFLNQQQAITEGDSYSFTTTNDPASKGNRFDVVFRSSATLPTNFTAIYAKAKEGNKAADVLWTVASDKQVVQYQVERSTDGRSYKAVGSVASQQSNQTVSYSYTDNQAISTVVYYRVKAMAADGSYKYSAVAKLNGKASSIELSLYPNPVQSQLQVQLSQPVKGQLTARIVDSKGQVVYQQSSINVAGSNLLQLSVAHLPQGTYQLTLTNGSDFTATGSFVK